MEKTCRIKFRCNHKVNIFDIFILSKLCVYGDKVIIYIDDRDAEAKKSQEIIDDLLHGLESFKVKHNCVFARFSDYFDTANAYIHRMIRTELVILNTNTEPIQSDLMLFIKHKNCKIFLKTNVSANEFRDKHANILYDNGWYRDILIETLIDYDENVTSIVDIDEGDKILLIQKTKLQIELCKLFKYSVPEHIMDVLITTIKKYNRDLETAKKNGTKCIITEYTCQQIVNFGISLKMIEIMILNGDIDINFSSNK
jgi:hypothetical protein